MFRIKANIPALATLCLIALTTSISCAQNVDFDRDISPILAENCWSCHGEDSAESGLRLDLRPRMMRGGDSGLPAIVPGEPGRSFLIELVSHTDKDMAMPPDEDKLPDAQIELLTRWIQQGAPWPGQMDTILEESTEHWSFQPVVRPNVPVAATPLPDALQDLTSGDQPAIPDLRGNRSDSTAGAGNPIDPFLLARLAEKKLTYSSAAEPLELIRRASIVLTGIAPTPEVARDFVAAFQIDADAAYKALVDHLLDSPQFGERWAQHWLDVIRWAETNGSEANLYRKNAWVYRDYVIRSFNEDKPYDQFVREQIAGDSAGVGEATGFLVAGPHVPAATVGQEPTAIRQARADRMDEIIQTVGASIMGVTMGCARCHNHKFDPISIRDYYAMTAVFQDIEFGSREPEYASDHPVRKHDQILRRELADLRAEIAEWGNWEENWGAYRELHFKPIKTKAIRVRFNMTNVGLDELEILGPSNTDRNLALKTNGGSVTGFPEDGTDGRNPISRLNDGEFGTMAWRAKMTKAAEQRPWVRIELAQPETISRVRMSVNREYFYETDYLENNPSLPKYDYELEILDEGGNWKAWGSNWLENNNQNKSPAKSKAILGKVQRLVERLAEEGPRPSFVGRFVPPAVTHILLRGSPESPRDEVFPAGPAVFDGELELSSGSPGAQRRSAFADWISSPENPLTARVMVNRIWHHVFGSGIVPTTSDFGKAGAPPTHPQLLDWLAAEFVQPSDPHLHPWSIKAMIRLMVMSDAFRQSSRPREDGLAIDAGSALLWRFPPKRVEAEVIRDSILQASGLLDLSVGGRSYRIHNEKQTYAQWEVLDNHGRQTWRRMIYQERMRRVDDQMFTAFDFPDCGQVRAKRPVSTTPLQALNLMNSEFVLEQSQRIASRALHNAAGDAGKSVALCFEFLLGRPPDKAEHQACLELARKENLSLVCRALINSNEFAFLP